MREIVSAITTIKNASGEQKILANTEYRLSLYSITVKCNEGFLFYHSLTGQIILLTEVEYENINTIGDLNEYLIKNWYLVPKNFDDKSFAVQIIDFAKMFVKKSNSINKFTIFPTTDCNARCFYCFELSQKRANMSEKTAHDVACYIDRKSKADVIDIDWFGGEPLYNEKVIDIICDDLRAKGRKFKSGMFTNGFLFDAEKVIKAKEKWNLWIAQVTLDGTEEVYNKAKAFIYKDVNAFERVLNNIELLINNGIRVQVRLNMDSKNAEDLTQLADVLGERFAGNEYFCVYIAMLMPHTKGVSLFSEYSDAVEAYTKLKNKLKSYGIYKKTYVKTKLSLNHCMADADTAITILPEGQIGKCDHHTDDRFIGSIYEEGFDQELIKEFKKRVDPIPECDTCAYFPLCRLIKNCYDDTNECTPMNRWIMNTKLNDSILNTYNRFKENN